MTPPQTPRPLPAHGGAPFELAGRAPAVLLVHGFASTPWEMRPLADALSAAGFACSGILLPGHGRTPASLATTRWHDWLDAVDARACALVREHGRVVLLGMSLGSLLALDVGARLQDRADLVGVVTLACPLELARTPQTVLRVARALGRHLPDVSVPKYRGSDVRDPEARAKNPGYRTQPLRAARELVTGQHAARTALAALRVPLLAVHGLLDRTAPVASSLELLGLAASRDTSLFVAGHSGHLVGVDVDRDAVAEAVVAFVRRLAGDPAD